MTNPESIFTTWHTPPEELVEKWTADYYKIVKYNNVTSINRHLASQAAQWGQQQRDEEIQRWFQQNTSEDLLQHLQGQATCILNEMFAARDLAREVDDSLFSPAIHRKAMKQTLEQLLQLVETHIRMEDLRKASAEVSGE